MSTKKKSEPTPIEIALPGHQTITVALVGESPLIIHKLSDKAKQELLLPHGPKTKADKAAALKHYPVREYRDAAYTLPGGPALLALPSTSFKGAMMTAAVDAPGATKAQIGRLCYVMDEYVPIYGVPRLSMMVTRNSGQTKVPDIRTRPILPEWAAILKVRFVTPLLNETDIANLMAFAGVSAGVGDYRPEKGKGAYGRYRLVPETDADFKRITSTMGRKVQQAAMDEPEPYDTDSEDLLSWYETEVRRRGVKAA